MYLSISTGVSERTSALLSIRTALRQLGSASPSTLMPIRSRIAFVFKPVQAMNRGPTGIRLGFCSVIEFRLRYVTTNEIPTHRVAACRLGMAPLLSSMDDFERTVRSDFGDIHLVEHQACRSQLLVDNTQ
jgi:hypothetical protein